MKNKSNQIIITSGSIILLIIVGLIIFANYVTMNNRQNISELNAERLEKSLLFEMRDAMMMRAIMLSRMLESNDPFEVDAHYIKYQEHGTRFLTSREKLWELANKENPMWDELEKTIIDSSVIQNKIATFLLDDNRKQAKMYYETELFQVQQLALDAISKKVENEEQQVTEIIQNTESENISYQVFVSIFGCLAILLALIVFRFSAKRIYNYEKGMTSRAERLRSLYKISSLPISIDEQIYEMLKLEARILDMEIGKVCLIEPELNKNTFIHIWSIPELNIPQGRVAELQRTFCSIAYKRDDPLAINHVKKSEYASYMCYSASKQESYIAHQVWVNGKLFGTISFSSSKPRPAPFTDIDIELIKLTANWVSVALERKIAEEEKTEATKIANHASKSKSDFLSNMSHEIRTPLTAIIGFADSLKTPQASPAERQQWTNAIIRNGNHLQQLINDILDLSKIEAGQLEVEKTSTSPFQVLSEIDSIIGSQARDKGLGFEIAYRFPYPNTVHTDSVRLKQILINLCGNSAKFTSDGCITIETWSEPDKHELIFEISDTGIGMSEEESKNIFKPFSQADNTTTRKFGGTGLGLSICTQLANKLGGEISCNSKKGEGSVFRVSINTGPLSTVEFIDDFEQLCEKNDTKQLITEYKLLKGKVLLAEDNLDNQTLITLYSNRFGLDITVVDNGQKAIEAATADSYDLILMDMQMPIMGGIEAIQFLRQMGCTIPIIALTANAMSSNKDKCIEAGADGYATKPIHVDNFYDVLGNYLPLNDTPNIEANINVDEVEDELHELINSFMQKLPSMISELSESIENLQWDNVQSLSHILKGMGGSFGQPEITRVAAKINKNTIKRNYNEVPGEMSELIAICDSAINTFDGFKKVS